MIYYFPQQYSDELFYSAISRYFTDTHSTCIMNSLTELFNHPILSSIIDYPSYIPTFCKNFLVTTPYSPYEIVMNHTMLPLFLAFMNKEKQQSIIDTMIYQEGKGVNARLGINPSSISPLKLLKYCPLCVADDVSNGRHPYWKRSHNACGVISCHIHNVYLETNCPICNATMSNIKRLVPLQRNCINGHDITCKSNICNNQVFTKLAVNITLLLNENFADRNISDVYNKYYTALHNRGLVRKDGHINHQKLRDGIDGFYPQEYLSQLNLEINNERNWAFQIFNRKNEFTHPIKHIVLLNYLYYPSLFI